MRKILFLGTSMLCAVTFASVYTIAIAAGETNHGDFPWTQKTADNETNHGDFPWTQKTANSEGDHGAHHPDYGVA
jgi:hypothetical protein